MSLKSWLQTFKKSFKEIQKENCVRRSLSNTHSCPLHLKHVSVTSRLTASHSITIRRPDCQACLEFLLFKEFRFACLDGVTSLISTALMCISFLYLECDELSSSKKCRRQSRSFWLKARIILREHHDWVSQPADTRSLPGHRPGVTTRELSHVQLWVVGDWYSRPQSCWDNFCESFYRDVTGRKVFFQPVSTADLWHLAIPLEANWIWQILTWIPLLDT